MQAALYQEYKTKLLPELKKNLGYNNIHQVPRLDKIVLNCCVGKQPDRKQAVADAIADLSLITGQKAVATSSKSNISNFKLRENEQIGARVTLRGERMYDFLLRFVKTALPRIRDFRGVSPRSFDGRGNYTLGINDQSVFPEIELDKVKRTLGFDITFVTNTQKDDDARMLLKALGMPFRESQKEKAAANAKE